MSINDVIPAWLQERLLNLERRKVHYESSFVGPHNAFLHSHFPVKEGFLVKPEARLRTLTPANAAGRTSSDSDRSYDSNGQPVATSRDDIFPDFLVSIATGNLDGDTPILIWELKRGDSGTKGEAQILGYAEWADDYQQWKALLNLKELPPVHVVLVEKNKFRVFSAIEGQLRNQVEYPSVLDGNLHTWLRELATRREVTV